MIRIFYTIVIVSMLTACGTSMHRGKKSPPLWEDVSAKLERDQESGRAFYRLRSDVFIDSFVQFSKNFKTEDDLLLMPIPSFGEYDDYYYFRPIDNPNKDVKPDLYGFVGINKANKKDINTLYIDEGHVTIMWDNSDKSWIMSYYATDSLGQLYQLVDKDGLSLYPPIRGEIRKLPTK